MAEIFNFISSDIKTIIFSQLSVDSILLCKFVCKTWRLLINQLLKDPSFVDTHTRRFLSTSSSPAAAAASSYISFLAREKSKSPAVAVAASSYNKYNGWSIIGSCNGLVCLVRKRYDFLRRLNVCICNPVTKEYMNLPPQYNLSPSDRKHYQSPVTNQIIGTGFGYVSSIKEYKFVRITCDSENLYVSVYTLGSGRWRMKEVDSYHDQLKYCNNENETSAAVGLLLNEVLYWSRNNWQKNGINVTSFDLKDEEFRVVPTPLQTRLYINKTIGVLGGCFCVIRKDCCYGSKVILVMEKEEEEEEVYYTWTNKFRIKPAMENNITPPFGLEGKIFSNYDYMKFACYDQPRTRSHDLDYHLNNNSINSQTVDWFEILLPYFSRFEMIPYMRSLVSPKGLGENADFATTKRKRVDMQDPLHSIHSHRMI